MQLILDQQFQTAFDTVYVDGARISGSASVIQVDGSPVVQFSAAQYYTNGTFVNVPAANVSITGAGTETIYLVLTENIITGVSGVEGTTYDAQLKDPASGSEAWGKAAADRGQLGAVYNLGSGSVAVLVLVNGQITNSQQLSNLLFDRFLALLANYFYLTNGSYVTQVPVLTPDDTDTLALNPTQFTSSIDGGIGFNQGYEVENVGKVNLAVNRPWTGQLVQDEPQTFISDQTIYTLDNSPILTVSRVAATLNSGNIDMTRGGVLNGQDAIPTDFTPVATIVSITDDTENSPYVQGTDFSRVGNNVQWLDGGNAPSGGGSYVAVVTFNEILTQGIRVLTFVVSEAQTTDGTSTTDLDNADISSITSIPGYVAGY